MSGIGIKKKKSKGFIKNDSILEGGFCFLNPLHFFCKSLYLDISQRGAVLHVQHSWVAGCCVVLQQTLTIQRVAVGGCY